MIFNSRYKCVVALRVMWTKIGKLTKMQSNYMIFILDIANFTNMVSYKLKVRIGGIRISGGACLHSQDLLSCQ